MMKKIYLLLISLLLCQITFAQQWSFVGSPFIGIVRGLYFENPDTGYAVGQNNSGIGQIAKTYDGGVTWVSTSINQSTLIRAISFVNKDTGFVCGVNTNLPQHGLVLKTVDGGINWTIIFSDTGQYFRAVDFISSDTGFLAGAAGTILKTVDGGTNWTTNSIGEDTSDVIQLYMAGSQTGYAVCATGFAPFNPGFVFKTSDGGTTWDTVYYSGNTGVLGLAVADSSTVYAGGANQMIIKTTDGGATWDSVYSGISNVAIRAAFAPSANKIYMVDDGYTLSNILTTTDAGSTWSMETLTGATGLFSICFPTPTVGYMGDKKGNVYTLQCMLPGAATAITGPDSVCSGSTEEYSIDSVTGADSYTWSVPADAVIDSGQGTTQIIVTFGVLSGQISVASVNDNCGEGGTISIPLIVNPPAEAPAAITGLDSVCSGSTEQYSIDSVAWADSYNWLVPADAVINSGQGTTQINVTFGVLSGQISVTCVNGLCGDGGNISMSVLTNLLPEVPAAITGLDSVCSGSTEQYSIDSVSGADSYTWLVPADAVINSGQGTTQINVTFGVLSGQISVTSVSDLCGDGGNIAIPVIVNLLPAAPAAITGLDSVCSGSTEQYSIDSVSGADSYSWSVPADAVINSGQGTDQISVTFGVLSGQISVTSESDLCGDGGDIAMPVIVKLLPAAPASITGLDSVCSGSTEQYSIDLISGASSYTWSVPADAVINSGQGTTQISVTFGVISGQISVASVNACGAGGSTSMNIVINPSPSPTITFSGNTLSSSDPVGNQWYYNGSLIGGATDSTYTPVLNGDYYTIVANSYECSDTSNTITVIGLSINNVSGSSIAIFPNPSGDVCTVYFSKIAGGKLRIINATGAVEFFENNLTGEMYSLNTASLPGGFYLVRIYDRENHLIATAKLIVQ